MDTGTREVHVLEKTEEDTGTFLSGQVRDNKIFGFDFYISELGLSDDFIFTFTILGVKYEFFFDFCINLIWRGIEF